MVFVHRRTPEGTDPKYVDLWHPRPQQGKEEFSGFSDAGLGFTGETQHYSHGYLDAVGHGHSDSVQAILKFQTFLYGPRPRVGDRKETPGFARCHGHYQ